MDRPDLYVVARLLERLWREDQAMVKTRLQVAVNVNYDVFNKYLRWMLDKDLICLVPHEDGHERVGLTSNGRDAYRRLVQWINEIVKSSL